MFDGKRENMRNKLRVGSRAVGMSYQCSDDRSITIRDDRGRLGGFRSHAEPHKTTASIPGAKGQPLP